MSRIGKKPIQIPSGVDARINDFLFSAKGPKGQLEKKIYNKLEVLLEDGNILLKPLATDRHTAAMWGTEHAHIKNMIKGVTEGFEKVLELEGIGYKAVLKDSGLDLSVGFNKPITVKVPEGITFRVEKNAIFINGNNKHSVGQIAAEIRKIRPPEPYKGKGIRYRGEIIKKKAGKKAVTSS